jgi:cytochrome oxidase Cu insertion factor (SCO1/SenC/PrrC family)
LANVFLSILLFVILTSCATTTPEIKQSPPAFTAIDLQGRSFELTDYKGKNIILVFYIGHT